MNNKVVIGGNLKLKNVVSGQAKLNNVISGTPNTSIRAGGRGGISNAVKEALLDCFEHVAWIDDDGQVYYQALYDALYAKVLSSISVVFEQGQTVIYDDDSLDELKQYLTVTANYDDGTTATITTYTLSGTLNPGTSSIQVSYENKKAYFNVTVTHRPGVVTITNNLTGCTTSNAAASMTEGDPYSATITASSGYTLTGASVSITMGGVDITSSAYSNGTISITEVTGSLVITITAVAVTLVSISAVYTQSGTVYDDDDLDDLKADLVVTATYSDSSTATVPSTDYTLSGTLAEGTSTVTVSYEGKTTTFTVTVTEHDTSLLYNWDFTKSLTDTVNGVVATTNPSNTPLVRDENGLNFTAAWQYVKFDTLYNVNRTYDIDVKDMDITSTSNHVRFFMYDSANPGKGFLVFRNSYGWSAYNGSWSSNIYTGLTTRNSLGSDFTVRITVSSDGTTELFLNGVSKGQASVKAAGTVGTSSLFIGTNSSATNGGTFYDAKVTGFRIYEGVKE